APVLLVCDAQAQEEPVAADERAQLRIPTLKERHAPVGDNAALRQAAQWLTGAANPVIFVDHYPRGEKAGADLAALAEALQAAVVNARGQLIFPNRHPLHQTERAAEVLRQADVILALEAIDFFSLLVTMPDRVGARDAPRVPAAAKVIRLGLTDTMTRANYGLYDRYAAADLAISGDAAASLPVLVEEVKRIGLPTSAAARGKALAAASSALLGRARSEALY